jgi:aminoglycoside/choline kinase family phosphotransferase
MDARAALIDRFLTDAGWRAALRRPLVGDASTRRYERLVAADGRTALLMDSGPIPVERWLEVRAWLAERGVRVPGLLAADPQARLVLIEDLGDRHLDEAVGAPGSEARLYARALELLLAFQRPPPPFLPPLDAPTLLDQLELFLEQVTPGLDPEAARAFRAAWSEVLPRAFGHPAVFVHRDLHCRNLMVLEGDRLAVIDFQDAFAGPPAYDLVSLVQDARRDLAPGQAERLVAGLRAARPGLAAAELEREMAILGAQRAMRILGVFARLAGPGGKPAYRAFVPRVEGWLARNLAHPALAPVAAWCRRHRPAPPPARPATGPGRPWA